MEYLLDRILDLENHKRITEDAVAAMLEEEVQTSCRRDGEKNSLEGTVDKQTVKAKLHGMNFPRDTKEPEKKKEVEYPYIEADEKNVSFQALHERKGYLSKAEKHLPDYKTVLSLILSSPNSYND